MGLLNLYQRFNELREACRNLSLAEFAAGDMEMLIFCYGGHTCSHPPLPQPSREKFEMWIARLEEISRRD